MGREPWIAPGHAIVFQRRLLSYTEFTRARYAHEIPMGALGLVIAVLGTDPLSWNVGIVTAAAPAKVADITLLLAGGGAVAWVRIFDDDVLLLGREGGDE
jgi:hypothetical protein